MRKAGVQFYPTLELDPDTTGLASTFSLKYKLRGTDLTYNAHVGEFSEDAAGVYSTPLTLPTAGDYSVIIESTDAGIMSKAGNLIVMNATIDDVKTLVDGLIVTANSIKSQIDPLDEVGLNTIQGSVATITATLDSLLNIVDSDNASDAVVSLRELLNDIAAGGSSRDAVIAALTSSTNAQFGDVKAMILGDEFLSDGITVNPLFGKGLDELFAEIVASKIALNTAIEATKSVVDANKAYLENAGYGLAALAAKIDAATAANDTDFATVTDLLSSTDFGLNALKSLITTRFDAVDAKLNVIDTKVTSGNATKVGSILL